MCPHTKLLDDFETADVVCMDCGLVVDRVYGHYSGGGQRERNAFPEESSDLTDSVLQPPKERIENRIVDQFLSYLSVFQLDNKYVLNEAIDLYHKIYGRRESGTNGFKKSPYKERVAIAFSICNVLIKQHSPRPPRYIARICDVPTSALLNLQSKFSLDLEENPPLRKSDWQIQEIKPQDYIDPICAELNIPFHIGTAIRATAEQSRDLFPGCFPTVLAATAIQLELKRRNQLDRNNISSSLICDLLDCRQKSVNRIIHKLHQHAYPEEEYPTIKKIKRRSYKRCIDGSYAFGQSDIHSNESSKSCTDRYKNVSRIQGCKQINENRETHQEDSKNKKNFKRC